MHRFLYVAVIFLFLAAGAVFADGEKDPFLEHVSPHFRVRYTVASSKEYMSLVLRRAEEYYDRVARDIGYTRHEDFWTWERRVIITVYPDQYAYARFTGLPAWSKGYATRDTRSFREHGIVSYDGQENFLDEVLPHEIAHLMVWDYLRGNRSVPLWFEEGVAQIQEAGKKDQIQSVMLPLVRQRKYIPFRALEQMAITGEKDHLKVSLFYAQSLSIVVFLIERYGQEAFYRLCRELRDGKVFDAALARSYPSSAGSIEKLEDSWTRYFLE